MGRRVQYGSSFVSLPVGYGIDSTRPDPAVQGALFFNTDKHTLEIYDGDGWHSIRDMHSVDIQSDTNVVVNKHYWVDCLPNSGFTATLPTSPSKYDKITFTDKNNSINNIRIFRIDPGSNPIMGTADVMEVTTTGASFTLIWFDNTEGWRVENI